MMHISESINITHYGDQNIITKTSENLDIHKP